MSSSLELRLPWPPSVNHYWRSRAVQRRGQKPFVNHYIGERGKQYRLDVEAAVLSQIGRPPRLTRRLLVVIEALLPDRRKRDLDNVFKAPIDALTAVGVWADDSQIVDLRIVRTDVGAPGRLDVTITELPDQQLELLE